MGKGGLRARRRRNPADLVDVVSIPVIASGGCGSLDHFSEVFEKTGCDAALAASLFHYRELTVKEVKEHLREKNIPVRL